jgi:hypothetical protein
MRITAWFMNLFSGSNKSVKEKEIVMPSAIHDMDKEAAGLNFKLAIEAHQKWKKRLLDVIEGSSEEALHVDVISRDDQCLLGKWIHGSGSQKFWSSTQFVRLRSNHAQFHACAGNVLHLAQIGKQPAAALELKEGDYARISQEVIRDLVAVYTQVDFKSSPSKAES